MTPRSRLRLSLKVKLALAMVAVVAALGWGSSVYVEHRLTTAMEQELDSHGVTLARYLAAQSVEPILYQDYLALERILEGTRASWSEFEYAYVQDGSHRVLAHTLRGGGVPEVLRRLNRLPAQKEFQILHTEALGFQHRDVAVPIYDGDLGVLHLGFRDKWILDRIDSLRRDLMLLLALIAAAGAGVSYMLAYRGLRPLGAIAEALETFRPGRYRQEIEVDSVDEVGGIASRVNAVTDKLHKAQLELETANRMTMLGRLAAVITHEVGNPLASVMTRLSLMERSSENQFVRDSVPVLRAQLERVQRITMGLSRVSAVHCEPAVACDPNVIVQDVYEMMRFDPRAQMTQMETRLATVGEARCVKDQLFQIIANLALNAVEAAGAGGKVCFSSHQDQSGVYIDVADDGPGVPRDKADTIFRPFVSTKASGTGLGLAISRNMLRQQGGDIQLVHHDGAGARFRIRLPANAADGCIPEQQR